MAKRPSKSCSERTHRGVHIHAPPRDSRCILVHKSSYNRTFQPTVRIGHRLAEVIVRVIAAPGARQARELPSPTLHGTSHEKSSQRYSRPRLLDLLCVYCEAVVQTLWAVLLTLVRMDD